LNKLDFAQTISIVANLGVIAGIVFLGLELRYNADNRDLAELRERARAGEELSRVEYWRVDGSIMAIFVMLEWTFRELSADSLEMNQVREVQRYNFENDASYRRVWEGRKNSFDPAFVEWIEQNVVEYVDR
jgi:hypothetical protein